MPVTLHQPGHRHPGLGRRRAPEHRCQVDDIEDHYHQPNHNTDANGGGSDIFDSADLFVFTGLQEIAEGFNGAVQQLRRQHQPGSEQDHCEIHPLLENQRQRNNE